MIRMRSVAHPKAAAWSAKAYCRSRDSRWLRTWWGSDWRTSMMARRSRCQSRILGDRKARGWLIDGWWAGPAGAARSACWVASSEFMVGLLVCERPGQVLFDDAAECQQRPLAIGLRERGPESGQWDALG